MNDRLRPRSLASLTCLILRWKLNTLDSPTWLKASQHNHPRYLVTTIGVPGSGKTNNICRRPEIELYRRNKSHIDEDSIDRSTLDWFQTQLKLLHVVAELGPSLISLGRIFGKLRAWILLISESPNRVLSSRLGLTMRTNTPFVTPTIQ